MRGRPEPRPAGTSTKRLGVLGTLVWDTIRATDGALEREDWGGIAYSLAALEGTLPTGWSAVPIVKVGRDLADAAFHYLDDLERVSEQSAVTVVPEPNNRVELLKGADGGRTEHLTGGVPGWSWTDLGPHLDGVDALYVNFISGFEMTLADARQLPEGFRGPSHADLHSLFLGVEAPSGRRTSRPLPDASGWVRCFDSVQMNADEFDLFCGEREEPWDWVRGLVGAAPRIVVVTMGPEGAAGVASELVADPTESWFASRGKEGPVPGHFENVTPTVGSPPEDARIPGDAIGCGDVWGATFFGSFLGDGDFKASMQRANEMARRNLTTQGSTALLREVRGGSSFPVDTEAGGAAE